MNTERLDMLLRVAMEELAFEEAEAGEKIEKLPFLFDAKVEEKFYRRVFANKVKSACSVSLRVLKRVAVACVIIIAVAFSAAMCINTIRASFFEAMVKWYDEYIGITFDESETPRDDVHVKYLPTFLPEDWVFCVCDENFSINIYDLIGPNDEYILYQHIVDNNDEIWVNDNGVLEEITFRDGRLAYLVYYEADNMYNLAWKAGSSTLQFTSFNVDRETLLLIAESVKQK